ncbi:MAG TPA: methyltransferase domain-containing protein [Thermomicrobiales bacterium]|nr:methyltransferase domain-containing protein [Thermomicrobiales bacterium]
MIQPNNEDPSSLARHRGDYGVDAPYVPLGLGLVGAFWAIVGAVLLRRRGRWPGIAGIASGAVFLTSAGWYLFATRRGKFAIWAEILQQLGLRGDERVLDLGCGRGAVLLMAARLLPRGKAVGVDLWNATDQSGNARAATERNAQREGVADRVEIETADMRDLPFPDETFDVVLSNLALHNLPTAADRARAIDEAVRVLRPGGLLRIVDFHATEDYARHLGGWKMADVSHRPLGWRSWYGGPWASMKLVTARKPERA